MTNDIDFDYEYKRIVEKVEEFNKINKINTDIQGYWNSATIFEMLEIKTGHMYIHNSGAYKLDKFVKDYPYKPRTYEDLFKIFKLRFKERFDEYMKS